MENTKCPYRSMKTKQNSIPMEDLENRVSQAGCPRGYTGGGCPMMNSFGTDPRDTMFEYFFEIPMFHYRLTKMPQHLRNTLELNSDKLKQLRQKDFSSIFLMSEEIKEKANSLYNEGKYRSAITAYTYAYSLFKWVEPKNKEENSLIVQDEELTICRSKTDPNLDYEEESYRTCLVYLLKSLAYCYIHLRHYKEAILCLNESTSYAKASMVDVLFRRSQARMYNRFSNYEELNLALKDAQEAKKLKPDEQVIEENLKRIKQHMEDKIYKESERIKSKLQ